MVGRTIYVNLDSPYLGFTYFNFLEGYQLTKTPCIKAEGVSTCFPQEDEASDSEEEVPEVATATEVKREEGGTLNLTLDEVRHIRTALTRAELEVSILELGNLLTTLIPPGFATFRVSGQTLLLLYEQQVWVVLARPPLQPLLHAHLWQVCQQGRSWLKQNQGCVTYSMSLSYTFPCTSLFNT